MYRLIRCFFNQIMMLKLNKLKRKRMNLLIFIAKKIIKKIKELTEFCYIFNYYKNLNYKFYLNY